MNEDLSATIRTGVTVVLVAALVSTVLSLMVVAQTILTAGQGTLQSGVDRVSLQQYEVYNGGSQSGTDVKAAVSLYSSQDIAILIHTTAMTSADQYYNYNSLLEGATQSQIPAGGVNVPVYTINKPTQTAGNSWVNGELWTQSGIVQFNGETKVLNTKGCTAYVLDSARFNSQLIKDKNNLIVGIIFTQRK
ncbi:hypothetical protein [Bacteroides acidifaciens]|uniref:hypothetical protein n=1 Tax=Bacteroides acidifaciens TaxID=85831 RepID=UPI0025A9B33D|nr:hypothetical protein [Bacteroides acidifaciens]